MQHYELTSGYYNQKKRYVTVFPIYAVDKQNGLEENKTYLVGGIKGQGYICSVKCKDKWIPVYASQLRWVNEEENSGDEIINLTLNVNEKDVAAIDNFIKSTGIDYHNPTKEFLEELIKNMAYDKAIFDKVYHILI